MGTSKQSFKSWSKDQPWRIHNTDHSQLKIVFYWLKIRQVLAKLELTNFVKMWVRLFHYVNRLRHLIYHTNPFYMFTNRIFSKRDWYLISPCNINIMTSTAKQVMTTKGRIIVIIKHQILINNLTNVVWWSVWGIMILIL